MEKLLFDGALRGYAFPFGAHTARLRREEGRLHIALPYRGAYGFGERFDGLNQKTKRLPDGQTQRRVVCQVKEKFCRQGEDTYCPAPFFFTDTGFGFFARTDEVTVFTLEEEEITVELPQGTELFLFSGAPREIVAAYMALSGPAQLPPRWAFGPWISANRWSTQRQVEEQAANLRRYGFPATVLVVEAWSDEATFYLWNGARYAPKPPDEGYTYDEMDFRENPLWQDPKGMAERLHAQGLHLVLWQIPVYKTPGPGEPPNARSESDRAYAVERGLCVRNEDGTPYVIPQGNWFAGCPIPDFTNPETRRVWFNQRQYLLDMGVDGFKTDGGEFIYSAGARFQDGSTGAQMKNRYAQSYVEAYSRFAGPARVLFSRAGYTGQHTAPMHWAGDQLSDREELRSVVRAGLSAAASGILFWGFDIGGFAGPLPSPDLYLRATQTACFTPVMQWHSEPDGGQFRELMPSAQGNNERSPWNLAQAFGRPGLLKETRYWHRLRMNLLPQLYSLAVRCARENQPMLRPLAYEWPEEDRALDADDVFLLGDSLLAAPVLEENRTSRAVWLPPGEWYDFFTGAFYAGGETYEIACGKGMPVFLRGGCGAALDLGESGALGADTGGAGDCARLTFLLAGSQGECRYCGGDGNEFLLSWREGAARLTGAGEGEPAAPRLHAPVPVCKNFCRAEVTFPGK